ncbi:conserved membrane hypothetical protein [Desulfamplus magnetovallimortis]|uniref:Uncharacterized protein n=1 Tax=Desulfamplus magnetovallimortis TaxID=1246637 RepID=A0A1W1H6K8_9BACT|nr:hypothetical protein [Desulfamplus magnetovallimortis]SLM28111.1 conserved membrane hypothetical protein [Desulfamplus magnetovallimortis]
MFLQKLSKKLLSVVNRLDSIPHEDPELTPEKWCMKQPCMVIRIASKQIVISQPLSTFWVFFLGFLTIGTALFFFQSNNGEESRLWWGISLLLWGIGALLAGTSYQAFGYEIKCAGKKTCSWTSWWELIYLIFQQISINAMVVAIALSCTEGTLQQVLFVYAILSSAIYAILVIIGGILPVKSLITFELMVWISTPAFIFFCLLNILRYYKFNYSMDLALLGAWFLLFCTMMAYYIYNKKGITKKLWTKGIWFSENDVLHIFLILWMIYIGTFVAGQISDY